MMSTTTTAPTVIHGIWRRPPALTVGTVPGRDFFFFLGDDLDAGGPDGEFVELVFGAGRGLSVAMTAFRLSMRSTVY
ncbi:hypothetical protein GCM10007298_28350 [Williamsia phyllosphaerae]|uniref:Uncharacterized protein n=1 Tax=Williamsia phyllosphaerae TaxID=885042 RepID=A0ABQ1V120_9NOCA|nr:hypothetical protein GCM10007298_28350 [Williamsia phyllosphaerae]